MIAVTSGQNTQKKERRKERRENRTSPLSQDILLRATLPLLSNQPKILGKKLSVTLDSCASEILCVDMNTRLLTPQRISSK